LPTILKLEAQVDPTVKGAIVAKINGCTSDLLTEISQDSQIEYLVI